MRGSVYRQCWCRDPVTGRKLYTRCPKLGKKGHGSWYYRYEAPHTPGKPRRQPAVGPFGTKKEAEDELAAMLARVGGGGGELDRTQRLDSYLGKWLAGKINLKARTRAANEEAFRLYWIPAIGDKRLADVRAHHIADVIREMVQLNRAAEQPSEMLRRMLDARADDERRQLAPEEERHKKSVKPLSAARVARVYAPFRAAMNAAVRQGLLAVSPCASVELPRARKIVPLPWSPAREAAFRTELDKRIRGGDLAAARQQEVWAAAELRPSPVMVWLPAHTGRFLEAAAGERLSALFCVAAYCGMRRDEVIGLAWADVDLDGRTASVRETGGGDGTKSEHGVRAVPLPEPAVRELRAWRKTQAADRLSWGRAWTDNGLVFTRPDGSPVPGQWVSARFETLAFRAALPPVRFHDLRHGAASLCKAAGLDTKFISALLGHSRTSFTDATYVLVFPEVALAAMDAVAAVIPPSPHRARTDRP